MTFAEALERSRLAYARGLTGQTRVTEAPFDGCEALGRRDRMWAAESLLVLVPPDAGPHYWTRARLARGRG